MPCIATPLDTPSHHGAATALLYRHYSIVLRVSARVQHCTIGCTSDFGGKVIFARKSHFPCIAAFGYVVHYDTVYMCAYADLIPSTSLPSLINDHSIEQIVRCYSPSRALAADKFSQNAPSVADPLSSPLHRSATTTSAASVLQHSVARSHCRAALYHRVLRYDFALSSLPSNLHFAINHRGVIR